MRAEAEEGVVGQGNAGAADEVRLEALHDDYVALLHKYGHTAEDAPPGAQPMQLRMFYIPDEPAETTRPD